MFFQKRTNHQSFVESTSGGKYAFYFFLLDIFMFCLTVCFVIIAIQFVFGGSKVQTIMQTSDQANNLGTEPALSGGKIILKDDFYGTIWYPALKNVPVNSYNPSGFSLDSKNFMTYKENGKQKSVLGIDVSEYQGDIDWNKIKAQGIQFAMIRVGGRGYGNGQIYEDKNFKKNIEAAEKVGLKVGIYFLSQAVSADEAKEEANFVLDSIKNYNIIYPVALDWEIIANETARTDNVAPQGLTDIAKTFCNTIKASGYKPIIYLSTKLAVLKYDLSQVTDLPLWIAEYDKTPSFYYDFAMWQYSSTAKVDGIQGNVDLDISMVDYSKKK
ncbi:MAG: glycoside hydrolase family 25 protein [Bacillota bacterium]|nr:glycoside hydrolase family 25 protein [Bacillota bacterium]